MAFAYANDYQSVSATAVTSADLEVVNGFIEDGSGNRVTIGKTESTQFSYRGVETLGVDRVAGATPTGDLTVLNGTPHVDGYGDVTLTDPSGKRAIDSVGGTGGHSGIIKTDLNGSIFLEYEVTDVKSKTNSASATLSDSSTVFDSGSLDVPNVPSDGSFREHSLRMIVDDTSNNSDTSGTLVIDPAWDSQTSKDYSFDVGGDGRIKLTTGYNTLHDSDTATGRGDFDKSNSGDWEFTFDVVTEYTVTNTKTNSISVF